jgi:hypothetical protein
MESIIYLKRHTTTVGERLLDSIHFVLIDLFIMTDPKFVEETRDRGKYESQMKLETTY